MTRPTVVLVQNSPTSTAGRLPEWLADAGIDARVVQGEDLAAQVPAIEGDDATGRVHGLVLLGGGLLPDEDDRAPWLPHERELTVQASRAGVPVLGICLGAQVVAHVTGGEVTGRSGETEKGMCPVDLLDAAADDALLGGLYRAHGTSPGALRMIEHHQDSVTGLPPDAVLLATSDACRVQAFRVGVAWGVQFHPEAPAERIGTWDAAELAASGYDRDAMQAEAAAHDATNSAQARALAEAFADVVHRTRPHVDGRVSGRTRPRRAGVR